MEVEEEKCNEFYVDWEENTGVVIGDSLVDYLSGHPDLYVSMEDFRIRKIERDLDRKERGVIRKKFCRDLLDELNNTIVSS